MKTNSNLNCVRARAHPTLKRHLNPLKTFVGCCGLFVAAFAPVFGVTVVENGRPGAIIVVPAKVKSEAAGELQYYIEKASGAKLDIVAEDKQPESNRAGTRIFVGPVQASGRVVDLSKLQPEGFVIKTDGDDLFIVGRDRTDAGMAVEGTYYGVCEFLERYLGVRWLMPGPLGEVTPRHPTIRIESADVRQEPLLWQRTIRNGRTRGHRDAMLQILKEWNIPAADWDRIFAPEVTGPWFRHQRQGRRVSLQFGHSYSGWWDKYHEKYPDIFAMQPNGTRINTNVRERLCVSNPTLWDLVARDRIEQLRKNPNVTGVSIAPNDGSAANRFCSCENCRAWDPPEAQAMYKANPRLDPGPGRGGPYPPLSERYFRYFNEVARRVKQEVPDRYLGTYAYSLYRTPPKTIERLPDNLVVGYVGPNSFVNDQERKAVRDEFEAWSKKVSQLVLRPNMLHNPIGLPVNYIKRFGEDLRFFADRGMRMTDFDSCLGNWGTQGLIYYVLAKLLWDPYQDVDAIVNDYCRAAYGAGAVHAKAYFGQLEALTHRMAAASISEQSDNRITDFYTDEVLASLREPLRRATAAIAVEDAAARARVDMLVTGLEYARRTRQLLRAAADVREGRATRAQFTAVEAEVIPFYRSLATGWAVASEQNFRRIRRGMSLNPAAAKSADDVEP